MRIVLTRPGITKFIASEEGIDIDIVPGIPFEVPESLGQARIEASPNLFRVATEEDEEYAREYKAQKIAELNALIEGTKIEAKAKIEKIQEPENPAGFTREESTALNPNSTIVATQGFDALAFIADNEPLTEDKLKSLERPQLFEIGATIELQFPKNISTVNLIQKIIDEVNKKVD